MKQSLQLKFSQHLALTPQLQQSIRLLQLSSQELNQELESLLQSNPMLELADKHADGESQEAFVPGLTRENSSPAAAEEPPPRVEEYGQDYFEHTGGGRWEEHNAGNDDDGDFSHQEVAALTLQEHLSR